MDIKCRIALDGPQLASEFCCERKAISFEHCFHCIGIRYDEYSIA